VEPGPGRGQALDPGRTVLNGPVKRPTRVAVVGGASASEAEVVRAEALGGALARGGAVLLCGGHGGVMEAAARGAAREGGLTLGILPGTRADEANDWIAIPLPTGLGHARNALVVRGADAVVAVGGAWGTLSEVALASAMGVPVALLGPGPAEDLDLPRFERPEEAAAWALEQARSGSVE